MITYKSIISQIQQLSSTRRKISLYLPYPRRSLLWLLSLFTEHAITGKSLIPRLDTECFSVPTAFYYLSPGEIEQRITLCVCVCMCVAVGWHLSYSSKVIGTLKFHTCELHGREVHRCASRGNGPRCRWMGVRLASQRRRGVLLKLKKKKENIAESRVNPNEFLSQILKAVTTEKKITRTSRIVD